MSNVTRNRPDGRAPAGAPPARRDAGTARARGLHRSRLREYAVALAFLAPLLALVVGLILVPVAGTISGSLYRFLRGQAVEFLGLGNYVALFRHARFMQSLRFTLLFTLVTVPLELALGLLFALVLDARMAGRGLLRAAVLIPWAVPAAVSGRAWELIYERTYGLGNWLLLSLGLAGAPVDWLGTPASAFAAVVVADVWKTTPFVAIILLAGLQAVPGTLYAQARIDGAGLWRSFVHITLPLLRPVLVAATLFRTIDALRVFDLVYVITRGGPGGATSSVSFYAYEQYGNQTLGLGSAAAVVLFLVAFALALLYVRASRFEEEVL